VELNDRIERALRLLPALVSSQDIFGARALLEEIYDAGYDAGLADACGVADAASAWGVTVQRARAHIAHLHDKRGIGRQFGGSWRLTRREIEENKPNEKYKIKP
jgi:hypothetical protein